MPTFSSARITEIVEQDADRISLRVEIDGRIEQAIAYPRLSGELAAGDTVILNTTAVSLGLGTGDVHFVLWKEGAERGVAAGQGTGHLAADHSVSGSASAGYRADGHRPTGHIMKLRYTPLQHNVLSVEEEASPYHHIFQTPQTLDDMPVISCALHSHLEPVAVMLANVGSKEPGARQLKVAYIMTEGAALPMAFSQTVKRLKSRGLIDVTITVGNAFGGDFEAVSIHSALVAARHVAGADVVISAMGPGITGTGTLLGFSGLEQGVVCDAAAALGGRAIFIPRLSEADLRERHHGLSHHTLTCLELSLHRAAVMVMPDMSGELATYVDQQLLATKLPKDFEIAYRDASQTASALSAHGLRPKSMGRDITQDGVFFEAAGAAGLYAAELLQTSKVIS